MDRHRALRLFLPLLPLILVGLPAVAHGPESKEDVAAQATVDAPSAVWGCPMCETVRESQPGRCPFCRMDLVLLEQAPAPSVDESGRFASATVVEANRPPKQRPKPLMPGVPDWLFYVAAISILLVSFALFELWGRRRLDRPVKGRRWDVLRLRGAKRLVKQRGFLLALQLPFVLLFGLVLFAGLFGNQSPERNIAPALTWTLWWTWLAFVILFLGKAWCTVCPWMAVADWVSKLGLLRGSGRTLGLEKKWPRKLRNIWPATFLFLFLTWLELGYGVTGKPWLTAVLGLVMLLGTVAMVLVFERRAFCRYACLVGRVSGLYSMFAGSELRATDRETCRTCSSKDCFHGNGKGAPCPTFQFMGAMDVNTYCTLCLECVKVCPRDNISWNLRPLGADLIESTRTRVDEAYLSVIMLSMSAFHGLSMTPAWDRLVGWIQSSTGSYRLAAFTIGMAAIVLLPIVVYYGICAAIKRFAGDRENSVRFLFMRFSYSLLPIALFYHLAHNLQHIFFEGKRLMRIASDPFGWDWNLFGTADMLVDAVLPVSVGWSIQVGLIIVGHVFGIFIAHRAAVALYGNRRRATLSQVPMLAAMLLFSFQSLWLIAQPMVMRTAM